MRGEAVPGVLRISWLPGACTDPLLADRFISQKERLIQYLHLDQRPVDLTSPRSTDDT